MTLALPDEERLTRKATAVRPEVKGPIRCHKCQLKCRDAAEYLNHECEPNPHVGSAPKQFIVRAHRNWQQRSNSPM
jgi:hypothetical protein